MNRPSAPKGFSIFLMALVFVAVSLVLGLAWSVGMALLMRDPLSEIFPFGILFGLLFTGSILAYYFIWKKLYVRQRELPLGDLHTQGLILAADPASFFLDSKDLAQYTVEVSVPTGRYPLTLTLEHYPHKKQPIQRPLRATLTLAPQPEERKELLGSVPCQSGTVALIDQIALKDFTQVGPDRIGLFVGPGHHEAAEKIRDKFQLTLQQETEFITRIQEPLNQNLADAIPIFLRDDEKLYFMVKTNSSYDQLADELVKNQAPVFSYANLTLSKESPSNIIVFSLGSKDKPCQVFGHYAGDSLVAISLELS